jgi:hypothetical protein
MDKINTQIKIRAHKHTYQGEYQIFFPTLNNFSMVFRMLLSLCLFLLK